MTTDPTGTGAIPQEAVEEIAAEIAAELLCPNLAPHRGAQWEAETDRVPRAVAEDVVVRYSKKVAGLTADLAAERERADALADEKDALNDRIIRQRADLAAARQQLDAVRALAEAAKPSTSLRPADCTEACGDGACDCSGNWRVRSWTLNPAAVLAALAVAPTDAPATKDGGE